MTNQEIFEMLAEAESALFHKWSDMPKGEERDTIKIAHTAARNALEAFATATGCHN